MLRKIIDYFVFSSLYIAICAVVMIWQTSRLLLGTSPPGRLLGFVFFATICSYNFHWYLTPRTAEPSRRVLWTHHHKTLHFVLYLTGVVGAGVYFLYLLPWLPSLCLAILLTFLYSAPKLPWPIFRQLQKIAIGKTIFLALVWVYVTTIMPLIVQDAQWHPSYILFVASRFFFTYALCIIFDYRDRKDDRNQGIKSLVTMLNDKSIDRLFCIALALFFLTSFALSIYHIPAFYIFLLVLPGLILGGIYRETKRNASDDLYYIVLDGLMMFSGLLMLIFRI